jgi:hypothetical protein
MDNLKGIVAQLEGLLAGRASKDEALVLIAKALRRIADGDDFLANQDVLGTKDILKD